MDKTTNTLTSILKETSPEKVSDYLNSEKDDLILDDKPFAAYMRSCIRQHGLLQQEVFANADVSEGYGYKIISEEKHTKQRDTILRLCLGAKMSLDETQRALKIYGMSPLYPRFSRDAVILVAFNSKLFNVSDVNALLCQNDESPLRSCDI